MDIKIAGEIINRKKNEMQMTRKDLAKRSGVSEYILQNYLDGTVVNAKQEVVDLLCLALNLSPMKIDKKIIYGKCEYCEAMFPKNTMNAIYCSKDCCRKGNYRRTAEKKAKEKNKKDQLSNLAAAAREAGMTYGQYVNRYKI